VARLTTFFLPSPWRLKLPRSWPAKVTLTVPLVAVFCTTSASRLALMFERVSIAPCFLVVVRVFLKWPWPVTRFQPSPSRARSSSGTVVQRSSVVVALPAVSRVRAWMQYVVPDDAGTSAWLPGASSTTIAGVVNALLFQATEEA